MIRCVQDLSASGTAFPTGLQGAFQEYPNLEPIDATVLDARVAPAPNIGVGTLWIENFFASGLSSPPPSTGGIVNEGDALYTPSAFYGQSVPLFSYGVLVGIPPTPTGGAGLGATAGYATGGQVQQLRIRQKGSCFALCTAPGTTAIAPGTLLTADGAGNLTPFQPPSGAPTPTITPEGTTGAATWTYALFAVGYDGQYSAIGTAASTTTGNATLTVTNYNLITWTPVADAAQYVIVRTVSGGTPASVGTIGVVGSGVSSFTDTGQAADPRTSATNPVPNLPSPSTTTVAQVTGATPGTSTYTYRVSAILPNGVWSNTQGTATSVTTGNATLSPTNGNLITWSAVTGAVAYAITRTVAPTGYSTGIIGYATSPTTGFVDYGQPALGTYTGLYQQFPAAQGAPGAVLAIAKGTLAAGTTTPALVLVNVGGF